MRIIIYGIICLLLFPLAGCQEVVFYPVQGSVSGIVRDNNGVPMQGIAVSVTFQEPAQSPGQTVFPQTKSTQTDHNGYYKIEDLWEEILLSTQVTGFEPAARYHNLRDNSNPVLDLTLNGSPTVVTYKLSKPVLSITNSDTIRFDIEVRDVYNESGQPYKCTIRLLDGNQATAAIVTANLKSESLETYLFEGQIRSEDLTTPGNYILEVEVRDPDNHQHRLNTGLSLQAQ